MSCKICDPLQVAITTQLARFHLKPADQKRAAKALLMAHLHRTSGRALLRIARKHQREANEILNKGAKR